MQQPRSTMASAVRAGQQAGQNYVDIHRETNKYANKPGEINKAAYKAQMAEKRVATEIDARAKKAEIEIGSSLERTKIGIQSDKDLAAAKQTTRKAGIIGALGMLGGEIITDSKMGEAPRMERPDFTALDKIGADRQANLDERKATEAARVDVPYAEKMAAFKNKYIQPSNSTTALNTGTVTPIKYDRSNSTLTGAQRAGLDVLGKYESDPVGGYDAVNQIGVKGGRGVKGYSGDIRKMGQHKGRSLTDMSVGEIMSLQNNSGANRQLSDQEWINKGRLHAVGRYQFIGPTFASEVQRQGIDTNAKFTPDLQDQMGLSYLKRAGIGAWVGPSDKATAAERSLIQQAMQ